MRRRGTISSFLIFLIFLICLLTFCVAIGQPLFAANARADGEQPVDRGAGLLQATAGGRLMVDSSDELDLLGDLWADVPFRLGRRSSVFVSVDTRTQIEKTTAELTFLVRNLDYNVELGWRGAMGWAGDRPVSFFVGQRGQEGVDADRQAYLRYLGFGLQSRGYRWFEENPFCTGADCVHQNRWVEWQVSAGPVIKQREVEGDFVVSGAARFWPGPSRSRLLSMFRGEVKLDGYFDGGTLRADLAVGPSLAFPVAGGRRFSLFVYYQRSRNPLGIGHSAWLAGIDYAEGAGARRIGLGAPEIDGVIAAGSGDGARRASQLRLRFLSPAFARLWHAVFDIEANILTAADTGDLYYRYFVGLERFVGRYLTGVYFYHRSNHQLAEPNDNVTSLNVLEAGIETDQWYRPGRRELRHGWGTLDGKLRAGWLIDSTFGEDERWRVGGGLRWTLPLRSQKLSPFVLLEFAEGDVRGRLLALGLSIFRNWDAQLEYRDDEQLFSADQDAVLLMMRYGF